jgi:pilus assembly protein Flp/PilA
MATPHRQVHCIALGEAASGLSYRQFRCLLKEISMQGMISKVQRFLISEDGPTAVEYAVMLALIVVVCVAAVSTIGTNAKTTFSNVGASIS